MMVDPAPVLPLFPTAMQSTAVVHEMPVRSTALGGGLWSDQVVPLFDVPTTYGVELRLVPTPIHVVEDPQATSLSCLPEGTEAEGQVVPPFVVKTAVPPPFVATPTAVQFDPSEHEIADNDVRIG